MKNREIRKREKDRDIWKGTTVRVQTRVEDQKRERDLLNDRKDTSERKKKRLRETD